MGVLSEADVRGVAERYAAGNGINLTNASGTHTISANVGIASDQTWTVGTGAGLTVSGALSNFGGTAGGYNLTKAGGGALTLGNAANFFGTISVTGGRLVAASSGTTAEIVNRLNAALREVLATPEIKAKFDSLGSRIVASSPEDFRKYLTAESGRWAATVKAAGIKKE